MKRSGAEPLPLSFFNREDFQMKGIAICAVMLGLLGLYATLFQQNNSTAYKDARDHMVAINFALFRNAAVLYAHDHPDASGVVTANQLILPNGWQPMRNWICRMEDGYCYVYGPATSDEIETIRDMYKTSFALGRKKNGVLVPVHDVAVPLPGWIPEETMVSLIEVH